MIQGKSQSCAVVIRRGRAESLLGPQVVLEFLKVDIFALRRLMDCFEDGFRII